MKIKLAILLLATLPVTVSAQDSCMRTCASWDTFCKSPPQIMATKCRLGVPVKHGQCEQLGIPAHYMVRGGGSLVEGFPCTTNETGKSAAAIIKPYL